MTRKTNKKRIVKKESAKTSQTSLKSKKRLLFLMTVVVVLFFALAVKMGIVIFVQGDMLREKALIQQTRDLVVSAKRGSILDRNGNVLAQSANAETVVLRPSEVSKGHVDNIVQKLAEMLDMDVEEVRKKATDEKKSEVWLKRQVDNAIADELRKLNLPGVYFTIDVKRYYPNGAFLTQTLGFTSVDGNGIEGLEAYLNKYLSGQNGKIISEADNKGRELPLGEKQYIAPVDGYNVVLTIDEVIQSFLEKSLEEAYYQQNAIGAWGIAMDPKTGGILAQGSYPDYDLNDPPRDDIETLTELTRNKVITDVYEPGSTFKAVTCASALDSGAITTEDSFDCAGTYSVDGQPIKCWRYPRSHGHQSLYEAVQNSCNSAFMQMGLAMTTPVFYDYIYKFGFGQQTGITFPSDQGGIVMGEKYVRNSDLARIAFGQSIAVTPLQLISSFSAVVNGGFLYKPMLVKGITDSNGNYIQEYEPTVMSQPIKEETSATMRSILESVVTLGSGKNAYIPGYHVGGKTGTAQKYDENGQVMTGKHIASFIGFAPADDPKIAVLIIVDEPNVAVDFGSIVAAPYVKRVLEESLQYMGVEPDLEEVPEPAQVEVPKVEGMNFDAATVTLDDAKLKFLFDGVGSVVNQTPAPGTMVAEGTTVMLTMSLPSNDLIGKVLVPDVSGKTITEAGKILEDNNLELEFEGEGVAVYQYPAANEYADEGSTVRVEFSPSEDTG
jgi:stage V sporulation protein D (sporulation-specific penicillin-binding protein)